MKKTLFFLFAIAMALTSVAQTNLAADKASIATSGTAAAGNDGNNGTRWESASADPQSWQVDLGEAQTFNTVSIRWEGAYASTFKIVVGDEVGADGYVINGTTVYEVEGQTLAGFPYVQNITFDAKTARYVKFEGIARGTGYGYSFWEFGVYNLTEPLKFTTLTLSADKDQVDKGSTINLTVVGKDQLEGIIDAGEVSYVLSDPTVGSVANGVFTAEAAGETTIKAVSGTIESNEVTVKVIAGAKINLFDGWQNRIYNLGLATSVSKVGAFDDNDGSVWGLLNKTTGADEASRTYEVGFIADLRGIYDIDNISIHFEGACSEAFTLSFAGADGVFGEAVYSGGMPGINNHTEVFNDKEVKDVRYVKFLSTKAATEWDVKIFDFSVYGTLKSEVTDTEVPTIAALTAGDATDETVTLNVTGNDNSSKYLAYEVTVNGGATVYALGTNAAGVAAPVLVGGLNGGTEYEFNVVAIDAFGNRSEAKTVKASTVGDVFTLTAAPEPTKDAADVKSLYSDKYEPATTWNVGWWSQSTVQTPETVEGDELLKLTSFNYLGWEFNADVDLSDMEYIHIDVLPMQAMQLGITPIMRGGLTEKSTSVGTLNVKQWNSIDLPLADFGFDLENYDAFQLKLDKGTSSEILYIDNVYFWKGGSTPPPTPSELEVAEVTENGVAKLSGKWDADGFKALDATTKANAYDFTAVTDLPTTFNNQNMTVNPNAFFIAPVAGTFLFNEVVPKQTTEGYNGYNIQIIDHFANEADHSVNTSIAPIDVVSPFFQRVTRMGGVYATTVLPFVNTLPGNVKFYEIKSVDASGENATVELQEVADVQAGVPYVAFLEGADITIAGGGATTITWDTTNTDIDENNQFVPTYGEVSFANDEEGAPRRVSASAVPFGFNDVATEIQFAPVEKIPALRAYLLVDQISSGINDVNVNKNIIFNIYTIDGRMVRQNVQSAEGLERGIYIIKGEKVLVK